MEQQGEKKDSVQVEQDKDIVERVRIILGKEWSCVKTYTGINWKSEEIQANGYRRKS